MYTAHTQDTELKKIIKIHIYIYTKAIFEGLFGTYGVHTQSIRFHRLSMCNIHIQCCERVKSLTHAEFWLYAVSWQDKNFPHFKKRWTGSLFVFVLKFVRTNP